MEENRSFSIVGEITQESLHPVIEGILAINKYDDLMEQELKTYERPEIEILVSSFGGDAIAGLNLSNIIENSKTPIHTICVSSAASAAFSIFMSGHTKSMYKYGRLLFHSCSNSIGGTIGQHDTNLQLLESLQEQYHESILNNLCIAKDDPNRDELIEYLKTEFEYYVETGKDWWIDSKTAFELYMVDFVIGMEFEQIFTIKEEMSENE